MVNCSWTRLTYLLFVLTILLALAQVRDPDADPRSLATKIPGGATVEEDAPVAEGRLGTPAQAAQPEGITNTASVDHGEEDQRSIAVADGAQGVATPGPPVFYRPAPASRA